MSKKYVGYIRVSTTKQEVSGLGLLAQKEAIARHVATQGGELVAEFTEIESGSHNSRPEVAKAIAAARDLGATLVIAKLDRLARSVTFISQLMDAGVKFVACDQPEANELTIHIFSSIAQWERKRISERVKDALAAKRIREPGHKFGPPSLNLTDEGRRKGHARQAREAREDPKVRHAYHYIKSLRDKGRTFAEIADELNREQYTTRTGGRFSRSQVWSIYNRMNGSKSKVKAKKI